MTDLSFELIMLLVLPPANSGWGATIALMKENSDSLSAAGWLLAGAVASIFMAILNGEKISMKRGFMRLFVTIVLGFVAYRLFMIGTGIKPEIGFAIAAVSGFLGFKYAKKVWKEGVDIDNANGVFDLTDKKENKNDD